MGVGEGEGEKGEQQPWRGGEIESGAPVEVIGDDPAARIPDRDSNGAARAPDRHDAAALFLRKIIRDERRSRGVVACLADSDRRAAEEELDVVAGDARNQRREAPDRHPDPDNSAADAAVAPVAEGQRRHRVDEQTRGARKPAPRAFYLTPVLYGFAASAAY